MSQRTGERTKGDRADASHDAGPDADAAAILAQGHVADVMGAVLNAPVSADGTGEELGVVTGLAGVVADLLTGGPQAGAGVLRICQARDPGDTGDQRLPGRIQLASGV